MKATLSSGSGYVVARPTGKAKATFSHVSVSPSSYMRVHRCVFCKFYWPLFTIIENFNILKIMSVLERNFVQKFWLEIGRFSNNCFLQQKFWFQSFTYIIIKLISSRIVKCILQPVTMQQAPPFKKNWNSTYLLCKRGQWFWQQSSQSSPWLSWEEDTMNP